MDVLLKINFAAISSREGQSTLMNSIIAKMYRAAIIFLEKSVTHFAMVREDSGCLMAEYSSVLFNSIKCSKETCMRWILIKPTKLMK